MRAKALPISTEDVLYLRADGGGGYGDPLDRDPNLVVQDVRLRVVSVDAARDTYGVVIDPSNGKLDTEATREQRLTLREARLGKKLALDVTTSRDVARTRYRVSEYLQVTADGKQVQCTWCGTDIAAREAQWRDHAAKRTSPVILAGPPRRESRDYILREFFCPSCATCLEVQVTRVDEDTLHDVIREWPNG